MSYWHGMTLNDILIDELGNSDDDLQEIINSLMEEINFVISNYNCLNIYDTKLLINTFSNWPPYIDSGSNFMINHIDNYISDQQAIDFLISITNHFPIYYYNQNDLCLQLNPNNIKA